MGHVCDRHIFVWSKVTVPSVVRIFRRFARIKWQPVVPGDSKKALVSLRKTVGKVSPILVRLRHAVILISKLRMSASKKINLMALIRTLTISTTTFERMKEKFDGFRQTVLFDQA